MTNPTARFRVTPMPTALVRALRTGAPDAHGQPAERATSDGGGNPCRHCLNHVPEGAGMLILAHRPFTRLQPYAECGPVFLCADTCPAWSGEAGALPPALSGDSYLIKGYDPSERIVYGTGATLPTPNLPDAIARLFDRDDVAFVDIRSSRNNCFLARVVRP